MFMPACLPACVQAVLQQTSWAPTTSVRNAVSSLPVFNASKGALQRQMTILTVSFNLFFRHPPMM